MDFNFDLARPRFIDYFFGSPISSFRSAFISSLLIVFSFYLLSPPPALAQTLTVADIKKILLSASKEDFEQGYEAQLERAAVLLHQARTKDPTSSIIPRLLGRLSEIRLFFSLDPYERLNFINEGLAYYEKAAALEIKALAPPIPQEGSLTQPKYADPLLLDLLWNSRLRDGEVTLEELERRYDQNNIKPFFRPEYWSDRFYLLSNLADPTTQRNEIKKASDDFYQAFKDMPVEIPLIGSQERFGPQKVKKINLLESWASSLLALSEKQTDENEREALFINCLSLYQLALKLPLDRFELASLSSQLDRVETLAPTQNSLEELWKLKDALYLLSFSSSQTPDIDILFNQGRDYYRRALRQTKENLFLSLFKQAGEKFQKYCDLSSEPHQALLKWADTLEHCSNALSLSSNNAISNSPNSINSSSNNPDFNNESAEQIIKRIALILDLALEKRQKTVALAPDNLQAVKSLSRLLLKLAATSEGDNFERLSAQSDKLAVKALSLAPNPSLGWFERGFDILLALDLPKGSIETRQKLVAQAFAAFRQYLTFGAPKIDILRRTASLIWLECERTPRLKSIGYALLADVCRRLIELKPDDPDYHFALGLTLYCLLASTPNWADDKNINSSLASKKAFDECLKAYLLGLELLSEQKDLSGTYLSSDLEDLTWLRVRVDLKDKLDSGATGANKSFGWPFEPPQALLSEAASHPALKIPSLTFQERLAASLNREIERLLINLRYEPLPSWHKFRLATFLRRCASSGYPPLEDQMAFLRLADKILASAQQELTSEKNLKLSSGTTPAEVAITELAQTLAERGLVMAEISLVSPKDAAYLLSEAERFWREAEKESPRSSRYARACWAGWSVNSKELIPLLSHTALDQDLLIWPTLEQAGFEPSFKKLIKESWFKAAWFGYARP
ncbi:MAG: hypothetical protein LBV23_03995 [Deltaproteobacteria bacterium]|jgi:hypothetical protein|nr:hypothetical protein [Deltaproteobacteria bacterium]